jgi:hypothetical protein
MKTHHRDEASAPAAVNAGGVKVLDRKITTRETMTHMAEKSQRPSGSTVLVP